MIRSLILAGLVAIAGGLLWRLNSMLNIPTPPRIGDRCEGRDGKFFEFNLARPADEDLQAEYRAINKDHFSNGLPDIPVHWDDNAFDSAKASAENLRLQGEHLHCGAKAVIILNPALRDDAKARARTLSHEMVHEYLFARGDATTKHGPPFQATLRRLYDEGAFEAIRATDAERADLRARLDAEKAELEGLERSMELSRRTIAASEGDFNALNDRIRTANALGQGWPSDGETRSTQSKLRAEISDYNSLVKDYNGKIKEFNQDVGRYNLMLAYPDGLDEDRLYSAKATVDLHSTR
ncbi:MAG: SprT-like domain-containing protein [Elusimicrobiota bacterium]